MLCHNLSLKKTQFLFLQHLFYFQLQHLLQYFKNLLPPPTAHFCKHQHLLSIINWLPQWSRYFIGLMRFAYKTFFVVSFYLALECIANFYATAKFKYKRHCLYNQLILFINPLFWLCEPLFAWFYIVLFE